MKINKNDGVAEWIAYPADESKEAPPPGASYIFLVEHRLQFSVANTWLLAYVLVLSKSYTNVNNYRKAPFIVPWDISEISL